MKTVSLSSLLEQFPSTKKMLGEASNSPEAFAGNISHGAYQLGSKILDLIAEGKGTVTFSDEELGEFTDGLKDLRNEPGVGKKEINRVIKFLNEI